MIKVAFLADYSEVVPILAHWFRAQWPDYYAKRTPATIAQGFQTNANRHALPVRLVAFVDEELAGTIVLRERAIKTLPDYTPALGGLLVAQPYRRRGVGSELIRAGTNVARAQGYKTLYATTSAAGSLLENLGWLLIDTVPHGKEQLALYQCLL
jgi:predicted N-acetyltransferase YhbS